MTYKNKKNTKKIRDIFFDVYIWSNITHKDTLIGCMSIPENKLKSVSAFAICQYIKNHLSEFTKKYTEAEIQDETCRFILPTLVLTNLSDKVVLTLSNIHRL